MTEVVVPPGKFMVDPYLDWTAKEGVPVYEDFGLDLLALPTKAWPRFGVDGAIVHVKGRGDAMTVFLLDLPPGGKTVPQKHIFEAAFFKLHDWGARGQGASHIQLILAGGVLHSHISEMPVGTYKKADRHPPDVHIYIISGEGYSLLWREGDKDLIRVDWRHGWVFAPPDMMFHQHFNACAEPVRYIAFTQGSVRYPISEHMRRDHAPVVPALEKRDQPSVQ